jgi:hypothetical protein
MIKIPTKYTLGKPSGDTIQIFKNDKPVGFGTMGTVSCLEKIFIDEGSNKQDWFIAEGSNVFKVSREQYKLSLVEILNNMQIEFSDTDDIEKLQTLIGRYNGN